MNSKAQEYIDKKLEDINKKKNSEMEKFLISEGLYEKAYPEENKYSYEYSYTETDPVTQETKYFKKVAIEVTDEEYLEIKRAYEMTKEEKPAESNPTGDLLKVIGVLIYIGGAIAGLIIGSETESFITGLLYCVGAFVSGTSFLGFARIIELLTDIKNKD